MPSKVKLRLSKAHKSLASWFGASSSGSSNRISTPQLVKRPVHVTYDHATQTYHGLPAQWQAEFDKKRAESVSDAIPQAEAEAARADPETMQPAPGAAATAGRVWFDQCTRRFLNLPRHWRERLQRNNLTDWPEFQRNPDLLTAVFSMMDEELQRMDLSEMGLDASLYSSTSSEAADGMAGRNDSSDDSSAFAASPSSPAQHQATGHRHQAPPDESALAASRRPPPSGNGRVVWTQQRSFVKDDDSDSEEVAEL